MTKLNVEKVNGVKGHLDSIIDGINSIGVLRDRVQEAMDKVIEPAKVNAVLSKKADIDSLESEEVLSFFRVIYDQIKDGTFNPDNFILDNDNEIELVRNEEGKIDRTKAINNGNVFDPKFKDRFLTEHKVNGKEYANETKRVAVILFAKTGIIERQYQKDLYDFDSVKFEQVLKSLKATTLRSLQNSVSTLEQYIDFAINDGKASSDKGNIATRYNRGSVLSDFLDKKAEENMIFTKSEIDSLSGYADNAQDGVILSLLFDGVSHKRKFVELRNLRWQDVDKDNLVINIPQLVDEDTGEILKERQVPISHNTRMMIDSAVAETKYVSIKGENKRNYKIAESDYILRGLRNNYQIKWENVAQRILRIAKNEGYPYLNATNIVYSGQIHYARELMNDGMDIDDACREVMKRFDINDNESAFFYLKGRIEKAKLILSN